MAKARILAPWVGDKDRSAIYHVVSRVRTPKFLFDAEAKDQLVAYIRMYEAFCGVRVLTYCVMGNHFHLLVEIPPSCAHELSDEELLKRIAILYPEERVAMVREQLKVLSKATSAKKKAEYKELREKYTRRMWDLGLFVKTLKQRFTSWYNRYYIRRGGMWKTRYRSVLVENGYPAQMMAAYIDLNPVRARLVKDTKDYRWCGYAEAEAGGQLARNGLERTISGTDEGAAVDGWVNAKKITANEWRSVKGKYRQALTEAGNRIAIRKRNLFEQGEVIGSKEFVDDVIDEFKKAARKDAEASCSKRPKGALSKSGLWTMRVPRVRPPKFQP